MGAENIKEKHRRFSFLMILLIAAASATVAISVMVSEEAFASDSTSQAAAVDNTCLNPIFDSNEDIDNAVGVGNCGSTVSQQDESGSASAPITSQSANPSIELQRATTTQSPLTGESCEDCFDSLTAAQISEFENRLPASFGSSVTTIEELCDFLEASGDDTRDNSIVIILAILGGLPGDLLPSQQTLNAIEVCLTEIFG